jgi:hypothetical protein
MKIENKDLEVKIENTNKPVWFSEMYTDEYIKEYYDQGFRIFYVMTPRQNYGKTYWAFRKFKEINEGTGKLFKQGKWVYIRTTNLELQDSVEDFNLWEDNKGEPYFKAKLTNKVVKNYDDEAIGFLAPYKTATRGSKEKFNGIKLAVWDEAFTDSSSGRNKINWSDDKIYNFTNTFLSTNPDAMMFIFTNTETKHHPIFKILGINPTQKEHLIPSKRVHFRRLSPDDFDISKRPTNAFGSYISEKTSKNVLKGEFLFDNDDNIIKNDSETFGANIWLKALIENSDNRRHDFYYNILIKKKYDYFLQQEYNVYYVVVNDNYSTHETIYSLDNVTYLEWNNVIHHPDKQGLAYTLFRLLKAKLLRFQDGEIKNNMVEWIKAHLQKEELE